MYTNLTFSMDPPPPPPSNNTMAEALIIQGAESQAVDDPRYPIDETSRERLGREFLLHPTDKSILHDGTGHPITVDRMLATKPLQSDLHTRKGPGGRNLVYYNGETVSRLLNEVFGYDGWNMAVLSTEKICCTESTDGKYSVGFMARVRITHRMSGTFKEDMGSGDSIDRSLPTAVQNAVKGAITDAMKRAARHFGEKLGNSLYSDGFSMNACPKNVAEALEQFDRSMVNKWGAASHAKGPPRVTGKPQANYSFQDSPLNQVHRTPLQQAPAYQPNIPVQPNAVSINKSLPPPQTPQNIAHRVEPTISSNATVACVSDVARNAYKIPAATVSQQVPPQAPVQTFVQVPAQIPSVTPRTEIPKRPESSYGRRDVPYHNGVQPQLKKPKLNPYS